MASSSGLFHPTGVGISVAIVKLNDNNFLLWKIYARLQRLSVGTSNSHETFALVSSGGCGRGQSFGGGRGRGRGKIGHFHCTHYGRNNHPLEKCLEKFGKPKWANHNYYLEDNLAAPAPPENNPYTHMPQFDGFVNQPTIGNQATRLSTTLPIATLA
ncbi:hypothetical protein QYF36_010947 [Acer negundo]|nr:hypothetical protein QYF36_010947 [Acer negundo]